MRTCIRLEIYLLALVVATLFSCQEDDIEGRSPVSKTKQIDRTAIGDGNVSLWLQSSREGKPEKLSIVFSREAFNNLPTTDDHTAAADCPCLL